VEVLRSESAVFFDRIVKKATSEKKRGPGGGDSHPPQRGEKREPQASFRIFSTSGKEISGKSEEEKETREERNTT